MLRNRFVDFFAEFFKNSILVLAQNALAACQSAVSMEEQCTGVNCKATDVVGSGTLELLFSSAVCFLCTLPAMEWRRRLFSSPLS